jgi:ABC-2 type transport system ATP-binding protein
MSTVIDVKNLTKHYEKAKSRRGLWGAVRGIFSREKTIVEAAKDISFEINQGEFVGFVGPNGAGKTTTLKMLSGILYPTSGDVSVLGFKPFDRKKEFQKQFAIVMGQKNQLWWDLPVMESFELNKAIYEIPDDHFKKNLNELTDLLDVSRLLDSQVRKLSLGERMKCELIASLLHSPKVLFLDEPTIGMDVISQQSIREFLKAYNERSNATIILTSHYMEDIRRLCDRVIIIDKGSIIYNGTYKKLISDHADTKTIEVVFSKEISIDKLEEVAKVAEFHDDFARLVVPRGTIAEITNKLLEIFPVEDISIHEKSMERIVSDIFKAA